MKKIIEAMVGAVVIGAVILAMCLILKNISVRGTDGTVKTGITNIIGANSDMSLSNNEGAVDSAIFSSVVQKNGPDIKYISSLPVIKKMNTVQLLDYFNIKYADDETNYLASSQDSVEITDISDMAGNSILSQYDPVGKSMVFADAGTYTITFKIKDQENRVTNAKISIPVSL